MRLPQTRRWGFALACAHLIALAALAETNVTFRWTANTELDLSSYQITHCVDGLVCGIYMIPAPMTNYTVVASPTNWNSFTLTAVNSNGIASVPTDPLFYPRNILAPGTNLVVITTLQTATSLVGPWSPYRSSTNAIPGSNSAIYIRAVLSTLRY